MNNVHIGGSAIGSPEMIREMLELAATQKIHPWIIKKPMSEVNDVIVKMHTSGARYVFGSYVLVIRDGKFTDGFVLTQIPICSC